MDITKTLRKHVTIQQMKDYLVSKGWTEQLFGRKTALLFIAPPQKRCPDWDVLIPGFLEIVDFDRVMEIATDTVSAFEDRTVDELLSDILPSPLVKLTEIRALMSDCERLIRKYPDDIVFGHALELLREREHDLAETY